MGKLDPTGKMRIQVVVQEGEEAIIVLSLYLIKVATNCAKWKQEKDDDEEETQDINERNG